MHSNCQAYMYYESGFGICKNDIRKTWKLINDILSKAKRQPSQKRFKEGENIIYDKAEIAHKFNNCFTNTRCAFSRSRETI